MDRSICPGIFCSAGIFCTCKTNWYSLYIEVRPELEVSRGARCDSRAPPAAARRVGARRPCWPRDAARHGAANSAIQQTAIPEWRTCKYAGTAGQLCDGGRAPGHDRAARPMGAARCGAACRASAQHRLVGCGRARQYGNTAERQILGAAVRGNGGNNTMDGGAPVMTGPRGPRAARCSAAGRAPACPRLAGHSLVQQCGTTRRFCSSGCTASRLDPTRGAVRCACCVRGKCGVPATTYGCAAGRGSAG